MENRVETVGERIPKITMDMLDAGMTVYRAFDVDKDAPAALVFAILLRAEKVRIRNERVSFYSSASIVCSKVRTSSESTRARAVATKFI